MTELRILRPVGHGTADQDISAAAAILRSGGLVAFPTETVYGLGARFDSEAAVAKVFAAKGRPADNPLIVHVSHPQQLQQLVTAMTSLEEKLMLTFWPGPLTLILPKTPAVPNLVTGGLDTVAVRMPGHDLALSLITAAGVPIVAPSANISGRPSPTRAQHVAQDLAGRLDALVDGGDTPLGLESTVVHVQGELIHILRPGGITREMLERETGCTVVSSTHHEGSTIAPLAPGMKYTHYAPRALVTLYEGQAVADLVRDAINLQRMEMRLAVIAFADTLSTLPAGVRVYTLGERGSVDLAAKKLYAYLREADDHGAHQILVEGLDTKGLGEAVMNRLYKAATTVVRR